MFAKYMFNVQHVVDIVSPKRLIMIHHSHTSTQYKVRKDTLEPIIVSLVNILKAAKSFKHESTVDQKPISSLTCSHRKTYFILFLKYS